MSKNKLTGPIPVARRRLAEVATQLRGLWSMNDYANEIEACVALMYRRSVIRRTPNRLSVNDQKKREIIEYFNTHPDASFQNMSVIFNCGVGCISRVLNGDRHVQTPAMVYHQPSV